METFSPMNMFSSSSYSLFQAADQSGTSRQLITSIESRLQEAETSRAMFEEEAAKACVELAACKAENARLTKVR